MMEEKLMSVSKETKQVREVPDRWLWTEPSIWTERMLFALERGVKGDKSIVYFRELGLFSMVEHRKIAAAKARSG